MELDLARICDVEPQHICLDCEFWEGFETFMGPPLEMTQFTPEMENDNCDLYLLNQQ